MKYIKLFEDFSNSVGYPEKVNRLNKVLNLLGISVEVKESGIGQPYQTTEYVFNTNLNSIGGSMLQYILKSNINGEFKTAFIVDSNGFEISPSLNYFVSKDKDEINDPSIVCIREPRGVNAIDNTINRVMKLVIDHFDNCTDEINVGDGHSGHYDTKGYKIEGVGKFIVGYLKLNKKCKGDVVLNKQLASYFIKTSNADIRFYGMLKKYHPNIFNFLNRLNSQVDKSGTMSDMGFAD